VATIGITDHAVSHLSDLVFLDLPQKGSSVTIGESFGEIESVKAVSNLYSPVSGEVIEVNKALPDNLDWLTADPWQKAWMLKVREPAATYALVHDALALALADVGVAVARVPDGAACGARPAWRWCFQHPGRHDLVDGSGRKLLGSAQRRIRAPARVLHHGSI